MAAHAGPLSHRRRWVEGVVQAVSPPGVLDLGPGYLDPDLLPVDLLREAYGEALAEFGSAALSYGADQGALVLREALAARAAAADGSACGPEQVLVTAGTSHALHLLTTGLAVAGQVVFVERTSYDFARRIFTDHGLKILVDGPSLPYVRGSIIDYVDSLQGAGFQVNNPNVIAACGCGSSFRVADEEQVSAV